MDTETDMNLQCPNGQQVRDKSQEEKNVGKMQKIILALRTKKMMLSYPVGMLKL